MIALSELYLNLDMFSLHAQLASADIRSEVFSAGLAIFAWSLTVMELVGAACRHGRDTMQRSSPKSLGWLSRYHPTQAERMDLSTA